MSAVQSPGVQQQWVVLWVALPAVKRILSAQESCTRGAHRSQSKMNAGISTSKADKQLQGTGSKC